MSSRQPTGNILIEWERQILKASAPNRYLQWRQKLASLLTRLPKEASRLEAPGGGCIVSRRMESNPEGGIARFIDLFPLEAFGMQQNVSQSCNTHVIFNDNSVAKANGNGTILSVTKCNENSNNMELGGVWAAGKKKTGAYEGFLSDFEISCGYAEEYFQKKIQFAHIRIWSRVYAEFHRKTFHFSRMIFWTADEIDIANCIGISNERTKIELPSNPARAKRLSFMLNFITQPLTLLREN